MTSKKLTIISAGQSNIDGRVPVSELPKPLLLPMKNVKYCSNYTPDHEKGVFQDEIKVTDLSTNRWGFDLVTYYHLSQMANYDLTVMKCSEGGTSIDVTGESDDHWTADIEKLDSPDHSLLLQFKQIIDACRKASADAQDVKAMLWHQGEGDRASFSKKAADHYYENLKAMFKACRSFVDKPELPIFCGTVSHNSTQYDEKVETALLKLAREDSNLHVIDMQRGTLLDNFHFDVDSSVYFGKALYNEMIAQGVVEGPKTEVDYKAF
ncbi:sialate O-acetylesterase [Lentilactobacillus sp. Marseille-Q4993]|uniref:sialate O-acetylesterase n=1 Tax=Lentilactobacillus sp. Marseille-Q4993 TaxID=3039492 RepID=UPI0024BBED69|nr:sialate O-acetylesterase [Lentilactobacillus sp. Marseille-Q4993]